MASRPRLASPRAIPCSGRPPLAPSSPGGARAHTPVHLRGRPAPLRRGSGRWGVAPSIGDTPLAPGVVLLIAALVAACAPSPVPSEHLYGFSVVVLDDMDGDGTPELAIGAPATTDERGDLTRVEAGRVCVVSGATGAERGCWTGATGRAWLGYAMTRLQGPTGPARLVACAPFESTGGGDLVGACHLVAAEALLDAATVTGREVAEAFGGAVEAIADLDGDGWQEVAIVSPSWGEEESGNRGRVTVVSGKDGALLYSVEGTVGGEGFGLGVATIADQSGDGVPELVVGAPIAAPGGVLHVLSGADGAWLKGCEGPAGALLGYGAIAMDVGEPGARRELVVTALDVGTLVAVDPASCEIVHEHADVATPEGVAEPRLSLHQLGDVDGDLLPDVAVASSCDAPTCSGGVVTLLSGATFAPIRELTGEATFGATVRSFTDRTGDGIAELLVGVPTADGGQVLLVDPTDGATVQRLPFGGAGWE